MKTKAALIIAILASLIVVQNRSVLKDWYSRLVRSPLPEPIAYDTFGKTAVSVEDYAQTTEASRSDYDDIEAVVVDISASQDAINLAVPFQPQAPHANWDLPYQEACEEASVIMVDYYLRGEPLSADQMDKEILDLVRWQDDHGYLLDVTIAELLDISRDYYGYNGMILNPLTEIAIKEQLMLGRAVIMPAAGRELGNPYFTQPGPLYHMLVIKGFTAEGFFITNDPGTRRGADYLYDPDMLLAAARDWDGDSPDGERVGLVLHE